MSFVTPGDVGDLEAEVRVANGLVMLPDAVRAVVVPRTVSTAGHVVLSDCVNEETAGIPPEEYALLFEIGHLSWRKGEEAQWCRLTFVSGGRTQP